MSREPPGRCGVVRIIAGKEWICVREVHDDPPRPGHGQRSVQWRPYPPKSERHYFRRRYPDTDR